MKRLVFIGVLLVLLALPTQLAAHPLSAVDGDDADWLSGFGSGSCPALPGDNSSGIYQAPPCTLSGAATSGTEFIWTDATNDQRNDHWNNTGNLDLTQFRMTGDSANISFLLKFRDITDCNAQYIAIAIDNKKVTQGSNSYFPDFADTQAPFNFEYVIEANTSATGIWDKDYNFSSTGDSYCDATNDIWEIRMPASALGMTWPANSGDYGFAVAIFCNASGGICDVPPANINDPDPSDAMDVITTTGPNTWDEVQDGVLNYQFTTAFGPTAITLETFTAAPGAPGLPRTLALALLIAAGGVLIRVRTRR